MTDTTETAQPEPTFLEKVASYVAAIRSRITGTDDIQAHIDALDGKVNTILNISYPTTEEKENEQNRKIAETQAAVLHILAVLSGTASADGSNLPQNPAPVPTDAGEVSAEPAQTDDQTDQQAGA